MSRYVPHAGNGLGEAMWEEGYTEADVDWEETDPCGLCGAEDGDDHDCEAEYDDLSESGNFDRHWWFY